MYKINNIDITIAGRLFKTARIYAEWQEDIDDPDHFCSVLGNIKEGVDIFTFFQRPPFSEPIFNFYHEFETCALLKIDSYDQWFRKKIKKGVRREIRRAEESGVTVKLAEYDQEFVKGIRGIYNETSIRQGREFPHYGKDLETIWRENSTFHEKSEYLGAYCDGEMIGFLKLIHDRHFTDVVTLISKLAHRDKSVNYTLIATAVQECCSAGVKALAYGDCDRNTLSDFKRKNGFERVLLPRYYIPLTPLGKALIRLKLHRGFKRLLPPKLRDMLKSMRNKYYSIVNS